MRVSEQRPFFVTAESWHDARRMVLSRSARRERRLSAFIRLAVTRLTNDLLNPLVPIVLIEPKPEEPAKHEYETVEVVQIESILAGSFLRFRTAAMFNDTHFEVAEALADSISKRMIPKNHTKKLVIVCVEFICGQPDHVKKRYDYNYEAPKNTVHLGLSWIC